MKKILLVLLMQFSIVLLANPMRIKNSIKRTYFENGITNSNYTPIPDPNFEQALIVLGYDNSIDGQVETTNITDITTLDISNRSIADLTGIKAFSSLNALYCGGNQITNLDVSGMTSLATLHCYLNQMTSLNINGCTSLDALHCNDNLITSLNASGLTSLALLSCGGNQLTSINVNGCTALTALYCSYNQFVTLNLNGCNSIQDLGCGYNKLTSLDVSGLPMLYSLGCDGNLLTTLDVGGMTSLNILTCAFNKLKTINIDGCTSLTTLTCNDNLLTSLDLSSGLLTQNLGSMVCTNNKIDCIKVSNIDIHSGDVNDSWNKDAFTGFTAGNCHQTSVPDHNFEQALIDSGLDTVIDGKVVTEVCNKVIYLDVPGRGISDLTGIHAFIAMQYLTCGNNQLLNLDISGLTSLITVDCAFNQLRYLNTERCSSLIAIYSNDNQLTSIDVSALTTLQVLYFQNNRLIDLNASGNTNLDFVNCNNNQLINLNLTGCINLTALYCSTNQFISLDLRDFPVLRDFQKQSRTEFTTNNDQYTTLDCTSNINLKCIRVSDVDLANSNTDWVIEGGANYTTVLCNEEQTFCYGAKVLNLIPYAANIKWYLSAVGGTALSSAALLTSRAYYFTETLNGVVSARTPVVITINPKSVAGSINAVSGTTCYGSNKILTLTATHRGHIQWQSGPSSVGPFIDIDGESATTLNTGSLITSTYFRAVVTNNLCTSVNTAPVKVAVYLESVAGIITGGGSVICPGINSTRLTLNGYLGKIQWQYSNDNIRFHNITINGTGYYYIAKNLKSTTYYRAVVTNGTTSCTPAISESMVIEVNIPVNAGTISGTNVICSGTAVAMSLSGYDNGASFQWQKATSLTGFYGNLATGTGFDTDNYTTPALTGSAYYRVKVFYNGCSSTSVPFFVTVQKAIAGTISGGTISPVTACINNPSTLTIVGYTGPNIQWLSSVSTTAASFVPISGANSSTFLANNVTVGRKYYRASVSYFNCTAVLTPIVYVTVADCTVSKVSTVSNIFAAIAYPNPFNDFVTVDVNTLSKELVQIKVYDMLGRLIEQREFKPSEVSSQRIGEGYPAGIYNIIINQGTEIKTVRVIRK